ncbi:MAG: single-stranded-DNA-specific exonuclease RecJ [Patescibacteria group bacterium]|nr:single-stranded-DNA-specific exonuclease RecJ [Patescibacteria group bacterium]
MHPVIEGILEKRGLADTESFLNPSYDGRQSPFLLLDMEKAVDRILRAMKSNEKIAVWHDYDCDGIPGGALLYDFFRTIRYPVVTYVPERNQGYGLNEEGLTKLSEEGVTLVITVDCGITDVAEVTHAAALGIDIIVTDHHLPQKDLPAAYAVVNAHREGDQYPFKDLCGTGVAFKLVEALIEKGNFAIPKGTEKWLLDLVALATVADMVPLTGENRALVSYGLKVLRRGRRPGMRALFEAQNIPVMHVVEDDLSFSIAPKVNASSRMASPKYAFELLTTESSERARILAKQLVKLNHERKLEGLRVAKEVKQKIDAMPVLGSIVVLGSSSWRPSLLGIAATSVVETYGKTVCLWGKDGELIKGSCRGNGDVNIVTLLSEAKEAFLDFGGHELSGGFSLSAESIHTLVSRLENAFSSVGTRREATKEERGTDAIITLPEITNGFFDSLRSLAPFGESNPKPLFHVRNVAVARIAFFGAHKEHTRITLADDSGAAIDAVSFFTSRCAFKDSLGLLSEGDLVSIEATLERSYFGGKKELRLRLENLTLYPVYAAATP